jgi:hypothetical protein
LGGIVIQRRKRVMSRTRTRTFVLVSALVLCLASIFVGAYADSKDTEPAENPVIRESAYPAGASSVIAAGGPYIVAATYNPGTASLDDDVIVLVYNTNIDATSLGADPGVDFISTLGTDLTLLGYNVTNNVIRLSIPNPNTSGFTDGANQWIAMKPGEVRDLSGILNTDVSEIAIGTGPVIVSATINNRADDLSADLGPDNNTVTVTFDANVSLVGTATAAFGGACPNGTVEFNGATLGSSVVGTDITLSWASGNHFLFMQPGVMNIRLAQGQVTWTAVNRPNGSIAYRETVNDGPLFAAAWYNRVDPTDATDDVIAAVFDQVVTNVDPVNPWTTYFDYDGTAVLTGGVAELWYSTAMTNIVRIRNFSTDSTSAISGSGLAMDPGINNTLQDFQNARARFTSTDTIALHYGPGIVRASYSNGMQADDCVAPDDHSDDELVLYLSEDLSSPADVTGPNGRLYFKTDGFDLPANVVISYSPGSLGQFPRIVFQDFHSATNFYEQGDRIGIADPADNDLTGLVGSTTGDPLYAAGLPWLPVLDESRPTQVALSDLHDQVLDNAVRVGPVADSLYIGFLRFNEAVANGGQTGREDGDEYFLYAVQRDQQDTWDKDKMATYINNAIPIGNLRPRQIDATTRLAIPIAVGDALADPGPGPYQPGRTTYLHRTADNTDIKNINNLVFLLASADWQGNMSRIETLNPDEFGWTWLDVTFHPPTPNLRVYIQEPYCTSGPALPGEVRLYGIHWIHDYEVDRVRFEYLKEDEPADRCDTDEDWLPLGTVGGVQNPVARGDAIQYRNNSDQGCRADLASLEADYVNPQGIPQPGISHAFSYDADSTWYMYYDADQDGIYSSRDAVVIEVAHDANPVFDDGIDPVVIGSDDYIENIPDGVPLAFFVNYDTDGVGNPAYYWAESAIPCGPSSTLGDLDPGDYIFRENFENYVDGVQDLYRGVNLWRFDWAPCRDLEGQGNGNYLVRTIAIDRNDNEDVIQQHCYDDPPQDWNSIEIRPLVVNCDQVTCALSGVDAYVPSYDEGTDTWGWTVTHLDLDATPPDVDLLPQNTKFIKVTAAPDSPEGVTDLAFWIKHITWQQIGRAANNECYADLNGLPGFQHNDDPDDEGRISYAPYLDDERFYDANGNFIYDDGETCVDFGRNGTVDTPVGSLLIPVGDTGTESSAPYFAYFDLSGFQTPGSQIDSLRVDVNHERPACPAGTVANSCFGAFEIRNWTPPVMTGPIRVETEDNAVVDVFHPVSDGDPYAILGPDPTPVTDRMFLMHVTAEDFDGLRWVRVWYRPNPACTPVADRDVWKLVHAANMDTLPPQGQDDAPWDSYPDRDYPYSFHWQVHEQGLDLTDSNWQFYAEAMDIAGNLSYAPVYPYGFGFHDWSGQDLAFITDPAGPATPQCEPSENVVNIGDSKTFTAELDPDFTGAAQVRFYFAPRIQGATYAGTDLDADHVLTLDKTILNPENGGLVVCIDGVPVSQGSYYTAVAGTNLITFLTVPAPEAEITVNYDFIDTINAGPGLENYEDGWLLIAQGDDVAPFTVEWADGPQGGVPDPSDPDGVLGSLDWTGANAYDIIARALIDVDGDGVYDVASMCDMKEPLVSEMGNHLMLRTVARPIVHLYGLDYEPNDSFHYPQQLFWPGNPFGLARLGTHEHKGSGIENDVFITASTEDETAEIASVSLKLFKSFESDPYKTIDLDVMADHYDGVTPLSMLMTMYAADYYEVRTDEIENVQLWIRDGMAKVDGWESIPMAKFGSGLDAYYQVAYENFLPGHTYEYRFFIDKIGDDDQDYADRRNMSPARDNKVTLYISLVVVPPDYYYTQLLEDDFLGSGAYRALVEVTDTKGMTATNIVDGSDDSQGPILFMHDLLPPVIQRFWAENGGVMSAVNDSIDVHLETVDGPDSIDVIKTRTVVFQYSPNKQDGVTPPTPDEWITFQIDRSTMGGWNGTLHMDGLGGNPLPPASDGYDNDGDGEVDESDEAVVLIPLRAIAFDDAGYGGEFWLADFPGSGNPSYAYADTFLTVRFDGYAPTTMLSNPHDGNVYVYGDIVNLTGTANDIPEGGTPDQASAIDYVIFQYNLTNDPNGWVTIDPTPDNNTDSNNIEPETEGQTTFSVSLDTNLLPIRRDSYMRLRMIATDVAGNTTVMDDIHADEIVVILNDVTAPGAFLQKMISDNCDFCLNLSDATEYANGVVTFYGTVTTPTADELTALAGVDIVLTPDGGEPVVLGRATLIDLIDVDADCADGLTANTPTKSLFEFVWDTDNGPMGRYQEGAYVIEARAVDTDGNAFTSLPANIVIRREAPVLVYSPEGGRPFVNTVEYFDDGIPEHSSLAILPDADTGDVDFFVYTADAPAVVHSIVLQWRQPPSTTWTTITALEFHYAPGSNIDGYHAWIAHIEDFVDAIPGLGLPEGLLEWRALVTDGACNTNANDGPIITAAVDISDPTGWDYTDTTNATETAPGEEITFNVVLKDAITDVRKVQLYYIENNDGIHHVIASNDFLPLENATDLDGPNTLWHFDATWAYPNTVYSDTPLEIHVYAEDVVGNSLDWHAGDITVRDEEAPTLTKVQLVAAKIFVGEVVEKSEQGGQGIEVAWIDLSPTTIDSVLSAVIPNPAYGQYNHAVDWVIDTGGLADIPEDLQGVALGDEKNTFPRDVNEGFLYNTPAKTAKAAREVVVVARTRYGDNGIGGDTGIYAVTFYATPVDANGTPTGPAVEIGKDELANGDNYYYRWHVVWDLSETNLDGSPMWQGDYRLSARAMDEAGNIEVDPLLLTTGIISIDNVAPTADVTIVPETETVERNMAYTFKATTNLETEDDVVTFYFKRHRDLNVEGSYHIFQNAWGTGPEDLNPDLTRPYSFDIDLGAVSLADPDEVDWPLPLAVGEDYDFVASVEDEVGNATSQVGNFDRNGYVTVRVVDTMAPVMTIVAVKREAPGNTAEIRNPDVVNARAFDYIAARNLDGDLDLDHALFLFREKGTAGAWTVIDAALTEDHASGTWQINHWDLRTLTDGATYEVAVVGVDDVGNTADINDPAQTPRIDVVVDYTGPDNYAMTQPATDATDLCGWYRDGQSMIYDLAVTDQDAVENVDTWNVLWFYKAHVDTSWTSVQGSPIHDDRTNTWMQRWTINSLGTDLYDVDAQVVDQAGNASWLGPVERLALDVTPPTDVAITNITDGAGNAAFVFHPNGLTDISTGVEVRLWASAKDDELALPADRETPVDYFHFMVSWNESDWQDLGTVEAANDQGDPTDYAASVIWNTTGIPEGTLLEVKVIAHDTCGNEAESGVYEIKIVDITPPSARIIAFDPDLETHGEDPQTCVKIYAIAESDPDGYDVVHFQYDAVTSENDTDTTWVNIGIGDALSSGNEITEALWVTSVKTNTLPPALHYRLRALVEDEAGNISIKNAPTILVDLVTLYDGKITFEPVRTTVAAVESASIQIESPTEAILTVKMSNSTDRPRVVVLGESFGQETDTENVCDPDDVWGIYSAGVDADDDFRLVRSLDDPTVWRGEIYIYVDMYNDTDNVDENCLSFTVWVSGADNKIIDLVSRSINEYPVNNELGTNGTVVTPGYTDLWNKATIRSGAWLGDEACLLVSQTIPPSVGTEQSMYITPVTETAYHMELLTTDIGRPFESGYFPTVTISYSDEALAAALASSDGVTEEMLTVRRWNPNQSNDPNDFAKAPGDGVGFWTGAGISKIHVNAEANEITFEVDNLTNALGYPTKSVSGGSAGNIFQVFVPKSSAPVFVYNVMPHSEYLSTWMTDADPIFNIYLNDVGGQGIDPSSVKIKIDGRDVATYFGSFEDADDTHDVATWTWGAGESHLSAANAERTVWELDYWHSPLQRDWLTQGEHSLTVEYGYDNGTGEHYVSDPIPFSVDLTAPIIEFNGGWVSNPLLRNVSGYVDANNSMLTVKMTDHESGIFVRPQRQEFLLDPNCDGLIDGDEVALNEPFTDPTSANNSCFNPIDWGIHYDLWRVDGEDEQADIDEFEERELLHQGTADELLPYLTPPLYGAGETYDPSKDLYVKLPIMGGGRIHDGDILEVTIYSQKTRTLLGEGPGFGCDQVDTLTVNGQTMYILGGCWFDFLSQQRIIYQQGVVDQVRNSGSQYVEQRFVVDMSAPNCAINLPGATQDPASPMLIDVTVSDTGVGMAEDVTVTVRGPNGDEIEIQNVAIVNGHFTGQIPAPLATGDYTITTTARDKLGHVCTATKTVRVEAPLLTLTDVYSYPNPFDPASGDAVIHFTLSKTSDVTIKVYDFAGNFVTTILSHESMSPSASAAVRWGGTANDGTRCANGAYIVRLTASDGARTEESNLKVVIWRE